MSNDRPDRRHPLVPRPFAVLWLAFAAVETAKAVASIREGAMAGELNRALAAAIEAHKAADARVEAHYGPEDVPAPLVQAETAALEALAVTPCGDDRQFFHKLKYMLVNQRSAYGADWTGSYAREILTALALHLLPPDGPEGEQRAPSKGAEIPQERILHVPSREAHLEGLDDHLRAASALSRALWLAAHYADESRDERNHDAIVELASQVAERKPRSLRPQRFAVSQ
jgi:hypothetical protein